MKHALPYTIFSILVVVNIYLYSSFVVEKDTLTVAFLDVGQGDAIFIESPSGAQMLIDAGFGKAILRELSSVMGFNDRHIDVVLATHPDADHIGGFPDVFDRYDIETYIHSGAVAETNIYKELQGRIEAEGATTLIARREMVIDMGQGVYAVVLFPDRDVSRSDPNDASVVVKLVYGETSFLLTGDAPATVEEYITLLDREFIDVDVLKVGHHGSKTSTEQSFLLQTSPKYAVISAGKDNRYGHPHEEVVGRLDKYGAHIISTAIDGTTIFVSDRNNVKRTQ